MNSAKDHQRTEVIIAIESSIVRLDVQDTLRNLGIVNVRGVATAQQALLALGERRCDVMILGLETISPEFQGLVDALERHHVPMMTVSSGVSLEDTLPRPAHMERLRVPFDSTSLKIALERALRSRLKRPDAS